MEKPPNQDVIDQDLIKRLQGGGDLGAFDEIYQRYFNPIFGFVCKKVHHRQDTEDITQEIFIRVFKHIKEFRHQASFVTWLYKIASNEVSRYFKKRHNEKKALREIRSRTNLPVQEKRRGPPPLEPIQAEKREAIERVHWRHLASLLPKGLESLPPRQREVVKLHGLKQIPLWEISFSSGKNEVAIKSIYYRGLRNLRNYFKQKGVSR